MCAKTVSRPTALIVEDAPETLELLSAILQSNGFDVLRASSGRELARTLERTLPDLILLDVNLPDGDGLSIARTLGLALRTRLIFVSARGGMEDRVTGLELGGDDYIVKPFHARELMARVHNVMRRHLAPPSVITFHGWTLDPIRRELFRPTGEMLSLTAGEFNILAALASTRPAAIDRDLLLDVISNRDPSSVSEHTVVILIGRLRRKMSVVPGAEDLILTVRGVGYMLAPDPT